MKKSKNSKQLYNFTKKQKLKGSTSTKDLDDSLEHQQIITQTSHKSSIKKLHYRTQSCPFIDQLPNNYLTSKQKEQKSQRSDKDITIRSSDNKIKNGYRYSNNHIEIQTSSNSPSLSLSNLSAILYRKNNKQCRLKKIGTLSSHKGKQLFINNGYYSKTKLQQQIKTYQLHQELKDIQKKSKGNNIKQQILENLMDKFYEELIGEEGSIS